MEARWRGRTEPVERKEREPDLGWAVDSGSGPVASWTAVRRTVEMETAHGGERHSEARAWRETGEGGKQEKFGGMKWV
ncbi:hypothetical protein SLA2020_415780 [Shorea laevis]